jgi:phosphonate transport system permease protein
MTGATAQTDQTVDEIQASYLAQVSRRRLYSGLTILLFVVLMVSGFRVANERSAGGFLDGYHRLLDYPSDVLREAWEKFYDLPALIWSYMPALIETINIAAVSTIVGALGGLILSLLGTRGLAKWPRLMPLFRRVSDVMRAIPEIVIALVLIFVLGGGPVPAMVAIAIHTAGALGKMFSEVAENADLKPVEGLASTGATWAQRMLLGVLPQVSPNYLSYTLLRFEINIRASAILGFVGAGGLGYELRNAMAWGPGRFDQAAAIFVLLFGTIVFFDQISSRYRNRLIEGHRA